MLVLPFAAEDPPELGLLETFKLFQVFFIQVGDDNDEEHHVFCLGGELQLLNMYLLSLLKA